MAEPVVRARNRSLKAPLLHRERVRERVERLLRNVEPDARRVHRDDVDALALIRQRPARPAHRAVPALHELRPADVRERGERAERGEALGEQSVLPVGAGDAEERLGRVVVRLVERDLERLGRGGGEGCGCGEHSGEEGEGEGLESHD